MKIRVESAWASEKWGYAPLQNYSVLAVKMYYHARRIGFAAMKNALLIESHVISFKITYKDHAYRPDKCWEVDGRGVVFERDS
ncbi:hypothetical protein BPAE_0382g00040 [Botrytis paeoniae]|uniref:Uncharacterized protein n=1 Tax=Botrytis paeoniae TaxID=278948 RepID=A0A4Z1F4J8_9HELO|nr:hypothetical protein BPAE_0382g00040 [Botrytis paeoniae]